MNDAHFVTHEGKIFFKKIEKLTHRELLELQTFHLIETERHTKTIKQNVLFWFYFIIASTALAVIISGIR
jgi:hypothetical protein